MNISFRTSVAQNSSESPLGLQKGLKDEYFLPSTMADLSEGAKEKQDAEGILDRLRGKQRILGHQPVSLLLLPLSTLLLITDFRIAVPLQLASQRLV